MASQKQRNDTYSLLVKALEDICTLINSDCEPSDDIERAGSHDAGAKHLWYPDARIPKFEMPTQGRYENSYPIGAVVHYTAGRSLAGAIDAVNTMKWLAKQNLATLVIDSSGTIFQAHPLDEWGWHAGKSAYKGIGTALSKRLVGIEVCCAGKLDKDRRSWFGEQYPERDCRVIEGQYWHKFTKAQETSLVNVLEWMTINGGGLFKPQYILGHDEISAKDDPGSSLSTSMDLLRSTVTNLTKGKV